MENEVGKNEAASRPAQVLTRLSGWKIPCTASCRSEKIVLLTKEKTMVAAIINQVLPACDAIHRELAAAAMAAGRSRRLSFAGMDRVEFIGSRPPARSALGK